MEQRCAEDCQETPLVVLGLAGCQNRVCLPRISHMPLLRRVPRRWGQGTVLVLPAACKSFDRDGHLRLDLDEAPVEALPSVPPSSVGRECLVAR
jgi:hypothetical protein